MSKRETKEWFFEIGLDLARMSDELGSASPKLARGKGWEPRADIFEERDRFLVRVELAGVRGEDISLNYLPDSRTLVIRGQRDHEDELPAKPHQLEIYYGEYSRALKLPEAEIDPEGIRGAYRNGFLLITVPKR
jgi:HSP20 family protein